MIPAREKYPEEYRMNYEVGAMSLKLVSSRPKTISCDPQIRQRNSGDLKTKCPDFHQGISI
jgi:hypothetical protein